MAGFWDKLKKGAQEAGEKAAQLAKIAKIQAEITGLGTTRKEKIVSLGEKVYTLYKEGKLGDAVQDEIKEFIAGIEEIEKKIADKKKEIEDIKKEMNEKKEEAKVEEEKPKVAEEKREENVQETKEESTPEVKPEEKEESAAQSDTEKEDK